MDTLSLEENTTVVGGGLSVANRADLKDRSHSHEEFFHKSNYSSGRLKGKDVVNNFVRPTDYLAEERPFFVVIGKAGVIAALEKLDRELRDVWCMILSSFSIY